MNNKVTKKAEKKQTNFEEIKNLIKDSTDWFLISFKQDENSDSGTMVLESKYEHSVGVLMSVLLSQDEKLRDALLRQIMLIENGIKGNKNIN